MTLQFQTLFVYPSLAPRVGLGVKPVLISKAPKEERALEKYESEIYIFYLDIFMGGGHGGPSGLPMHTARDLV